MKKLTTCIMIGTISLSLLTACGTDEKEKPQTTPTPTPSGVADESQPTQGGLGGSDGSTQIANPYIFCETTEQAAETLGIEVAVPSVLPEGYTLDKISAVPTSTPGFAQLLYKNGESSITYRTAKGTGNISGDYSTYETETTLDVNGVSVTCRGNGDLIYNATWESDDYTYSVTATDGLTQDQLTSLIESIA